MILNRSYRFRMYPDQAQEAVFWQYAGAVRFVYNLALEQRRDFWRQYLRATGRHLNFASQGLQVTDLRAEVEWLAAIPSTPLTQALRDLDKAYAGFFSGRAGYPTPRCKGQNDSFRFRACEVSVKKLNAKWSAIRVPRLGWVKFRNTRALSGEGINATICCSRGAWYVSFATKREVDAPPTNPSSVGIDRGVANTLALSNGQLLSTPCVQRLDGLRRRAQRALSRRVKQSARYKKQRSRIAVMSARMARIRSDWQHRASADIASRFGIVALEDLNTAGMTRAGRGKRGLNRSILQQGWSAFETKLAYKLEERGGTLVKVNPAYTSQECSACGTIDKASRESQASFACRTCGFAIHADTNAAINILRRSTASMLAEGSGYAPDETRTVTRRELGDADSIGASHP